MNDPLKDQLETQQMIANINNMLVQQKQWHDEFSQRERTQSRLDQQWHDEFQQKSEYHDRIYKHWFWQKGVWIAMVSAAVATALTAMATGYFEVIISAAAR